MGKLRNFISITLLLLSAGVVFGQEDKFEKLKGYNFYLEGPIITDSASTLMIPIAYDAGFFSSNKLTAWGAYYANIVFYNFRTDSSFRLFNGDTYIMNFKTYYFDKASFRTRLNERMSKDWILYRVKNIDFNKNGKVDQHDPDILYVSDVHGKRLRQLTGPDENVISIDIYHDQNFALIKLQRDSDRDGSYKSTDKDFCYVRLDLKTLTLGKRIEAK